MNADDAETSDAYMDGWSEIMDMVTSGGSWSGHERNCCFLNTGGPKFANVSAITGLDFSDDGRCVAPVDWDHDGDLDLWLSARTGPTLRFMRNNSEDKNHFVQIRLEGTNCNRDAIGARISLRSGDETLIRTLHAGDGYLSQASKWIHFGLGSLDSIDEIAIQWPGKKKEIFTGVEIDGAYKLAEGTGAAQKVDFEKRDVELKPERLETQKPTRAVRVRLQERIPFPMLTFEDNDGERKLIDADNKPILVTLWATWCTPCLAELSELAKHADELNEKGVSVLAINVETVTDEKFDRSKATGLLNDKLNFPFDSGFATTSLVESVDALQEILINLRGPSGQIPASFLIDRQGRLACLYTGKLSVDQLLADVDAFDSLPEEHWISRLVDPGRTLNQLSSEFKKRGLTENSVRYASLAIDLASRHRVATGQRIELGELFREFATRNADAGEPRKALLGFQEAVRIAPDSPNAHLGLGKVYRSLGNQKKAVDHLTKAVELDQTNSEAFHQLGVTLVRLGYRQPGIQNLQQALKLDKDNSAARKSLTATLTGQAP